MYADAAKTQEKKISELVEVKDEFATTYVCVTEEH